MDYNDCKRISNELKEISQKYDIPIFMVDERLMTAIHMKELEEERMNNRSNNGIIGGKLINTIDICIPLCSSPVTEEKLLGFKPNTIYIFKNRGGKK